MNILFIKVSGNLILRQTVKLLAKQVRQATSDLKICVKKQYIQWDSFILSLLLLLNISLQDPAVQVPKVMWTGISTAEYYTVQLYNDCIMAQAKTWVNLAKVMFKRSKGRIIYTMCVLKSVQACPAIYNPMDCIRCFCSWEEWILEGVEYWLGKNTGGVAMFFS